MFSSEVDNFFVTINCMRDELFHYNTHNDFSVSFPYKKDFLVNETWEVAVTSLSVPLFNTSPRTDSMPIKPSTRHMVIVSEMVKDEPSTRVAQAIHVKNGYFCSKGDYIKSLQLMTPIMLISDRQSGTLHMLDFDKYLKWHLSSVTDTFILDTRAFFQQYPAGCLEFKFQATTFKAIQPPQSVIKLTLDNPPDNRMRSSTNSDNTRDGYYYTHTVGLCVQCNFIQSIKNPDGIIFHSSEINNRKNHTPFGTINLVPNQLVYHKVSSNEFQYMNFKIKDLDNNQFHWLTDVPIKVGLHFRRRYYLNVHK